MGLATELRHTGLVVCDLDAALRFYGETLGFSVTKKANESGAYLENMLGIPGVKVTTVKMKAPDGKSMIELLWFHPPYGKSKPQKLKATNEPGFTHIALTVANIDEVHAKFRKDGLDFIAPPQRSPDGYAKVTYCRDPEGNLLELVEVLKK